MNYLLTILKTPVDDTKFVVELMRYLEPIVETDGKYVQYDNGVFLYNFDTVLDNTGLRDYLKGIPETFGCFFVLSEINGNTSFCFKEGSDLFIHGPEIKLEETPYIYEILPDNIEEDDQSEFEENDVVQKLMQKYKYKEIEPTLDEVLEKIYEKGISALSIQEQSVLKQVK
jgi:hypothetical protein